MYKQNSIAMKKTILFIMVCVLAANSAIAQKQPLTEKITQNHKWVYAYTFDKAIQLNASDKMWEMLLSENQNPKGDRSFRRLAGALIDLSDEFNGTHLEQQCGSGVNTKVEDGNKPDCQSAIDAWNGKYSVSINAQNVTANAEGYRLLNGYATTLASLIGKGDNSLWQHGYTPKSQKQSFIINMDNKYKDVQTSWSKDGSTFTINAPATVEVNEWDRKISDGLKAGWAKN